MINIFLISQNELKYTPKHKVCKGEQSKNTTTKPEVKRKRVLNNKIYYIMGKI